MAAAGRPGDVIEFFMGEVVGVPSEGALHWLQAPLDHVDQAPPDIIPRGLIEPAQGAVDEEHPEAVDRRPGQELRARATLGRQHPRLDIRQ
jgi:hypothetical protein